MVLNSINENKAEVTVSYLHEETLGLTPPQEEAEEEETTPTGELGEEEKSLWFVWVIVILVLVVVAITFYLKRYRKKTSSVPKSAFY